MNEGRKLTIQMGFFFLVVFVLFGTIVVKEKSNVLFLPKIENSITNYITENYQDLELNTNKVNENNNKFIMKVTNKLNKNHYFYITYSNKKITDTYKTDYKEGKTILNHLSKKLEKDLLENTNKSYKVTFNNTLDNYSEKVQKEILLENIKTLKIYTIEKEITSSWNPSEITKQISTTMTTIEKASFTPKNYTITITNKDDITESVKIFNIKSSIQNNVLEEIINSIINKNNSNTIKENKITYEYLN